MPSLSSCHGPSARWHVIVTRASCGWRGWRARCAATSLVQRLKCWHSDARWGQLFIGSAAGWASEMQWAFPFSFFSFFLENPKKRKWQSVQCCRHLSWVAILAPQSYSQVFGQHITVPTNTITHSAESENICQRRKRDIHTRSLLCAEYKTLCITPLGGDCQQEPWQRALRLLYRRSLAKEAQRESLMPRCLNEYS